MRYSVCVCIITVEKSSKVDDWAVLVEPSCSIGAVHTKDAPLLNRSIQLDMSRKTSESVLSLSSMS